MTWLAVVVCCTRLPCNVFILCRNSAKSNVELGDCWNLLAICCKSSAHVCVWRRWRAQRRGTVWPWCVGIFFFFFLKLTYTVIWCHGCSLWPLLCMRYIYNQGAMVPQNEAAGVGTSVMTVWPLHVTPRDECSGRLGWWIKQRCSEAVRGGFLGALWERARYPCLTWVTAFQTATVMEARPRPQTSWASWNRAIITEGHWNMEIPKKFEACGAS